MSGDHWFVIACGGAPVGDDDDGAVERCVAGVSANDLGRLVEPLGDWCGSAGLDVDEAGASDFDRRSRTQDELGGSATKGDQTDAATPAVGISEEPEDGCLGGCHAVVDAHRFRGVDDEQHQ
ncbi:MAG: hypothetical protein ABMA25_19745 [Ilumatobacteraceae bacterium]